MNSMMNDILLLLEKENFSDALEKCEKFVSECLTSFMEALTINKATDFAGSVLLYAKICAMMKKPWKCVKKLDSAQGALRFMEDFIGDKSILSDAFHSFAEAYERAGFLPEAAKAFYKEAFYAENGDTCLHALSSFFYYKEMSSDSSDYDLSFLKNRLSEEDVVRVKEEAFVEVKNGLLTDPVEKTNEFLEVRYDVEARVDEILNRELNEDLPFCIRYWNTKKRVLKEEFSLDWKTPQEMNPGIRFY